MRFNVCVAATVAQALVFGVHASLHVKRTGPPAQPSCVDFTSFVYAGCFKDDSKPRTLLYGSNLDFKTMTVEKCVAFCKGNDYRYAGLEYYGQCYCGATVDGAQTDESVCNLPCNGNKTESCGGKSALSIYQDPTFPDVDPNTISDYKSMGCYSEGSNGRTLAWRQSEPSPSTFTVEGCLTCCKRGNYPFAGVEFGKECYCGVVLGNGTQPLSSVQCNIPCTGDRSQSCGGRSSLNLYVAEDLESTEPCEAGVPGNPSTSTATQSSTPSAFSTTSQIVLSSTTTTESILSTTSTSSLPNLSSTTSPPSSVLSTTPSPSASVISSNSPQLSSSTTTPVEPELSSSVSTSATSAVSPTSSPLVDPVFSSFPSTPSSQLPSSESTSTSSTQLTSSTPTLSSRSTTTSASLVLSSSLTSDILPSPSPESSSSARSSTSSLTPTTTVPPFTRTTTTTLATSDSSVEVPSSSDLYPSPVSSSKQSSTVTTTPSPLTSIISTSTPPATSPSFVEPVFSSSVSTTSFSSLSTSSSSTLSRTPPSNTQSPTQPVPSSTLPSSSPSSLSQSPSGSPSSQFQSSTSTSPPSSQISPSLTFISTSPPGVSSSSTPTSGSICTSTITTYPSPTCEYKVGKFCANPIPPFNDPFSCLKSFAACIIQLSSCFRNAGYPESLECDQYDDYCGYIREFCGRGCPGPECSLPTFRSIFSPPSPDQGTPTFSTTIYPCFASVTTKPSSTVPTKTSPPYYSVPVPTNSNLCKQPNNPSYGYGPDSPVGKIPLPYLSCNNDRSEYDTGKPFKLYTSSDYSRCPSYQRSGDYGPSRGCRDACDIQYQSCTGTYAESYRGYKPKLKRSGRDNYSSATNRCKNQRDDCYSTNSGVIGSKSCGNFNSGGY